MLVVLAVLIGGITQIAGQSGPYDASMNRSFAAEGAVVAQESTATGSSVRHLMGTMQNLDRQTLEVDLDDVVAQTAQQESQGAQLTGATSGGDLGGRFVPSSSTEPKPSARCAPPSTVCSVCTPWR